MSIDVNNQSVLIAGLESKLEEARNLTIGLLESDKNALKKEIVRLYASLNNYLDVALLEAATDLALNAHNGQKRESGDPYIVHLVQVGYVLTKLGADSVTIAAGILHDSIEKGYDRSSERRALIVASIYQLGADVLDLVVKVTRIPDFENIFQHLKDEELILLLKRFARENANHLHKVAAINVADAISNLLTLDALPRAQREKSIENTILYVLPAARIVDASYRVDSGPKFYPYILELLAEGLIRLSRS